MDLELLTVTDDLWLSFRGVDEAAFGYVWREADEPRRAVMELDRSLLARVDGQPIGAASIFSLEVSVPGGALVPAAGITWVSVLPTHRRRGVLTAMMRRQLDDIRAAGREPIAALWASEPAIYQRFGFGVATWRTAVTIPRSGHSLLRAPQDETCHATLMSAKDDAEVARPVYARAVLNRPGMVAPEDRWWDASLLEGPEDDPNTPLRTIAVHRDGVPRAYARHRVKHNWSAGYADGTVTVEEAVALDASAAATLWQTVLGIDLMSRVDVWNVAADDPLLTWLPDVRRAGPRRFDAMYVRLVDLPAALEARTYSVPVDIVLDVQDAMCPWNQGRWRLVAGPTGATCQRTDDPADLQLDVTELGAAYLGGTSLSALADAGLVRELNPGRLVGVAQAFWSDPAPWTAWVF